MHPGGQLFSIPTPLLWPCFCSTILYHPRTYVPPSPSTLQPPHRGHLIHGACRNWRGSGVNAGEGERPQAPRHQPSPAQLPVSLLAGCLVLLPLVYPQPSGAPAEPPTPQPQPTWQVLGGCLTTFGLRNVGACLLPPQRASPGQGACRLQKGP